MEAGMGRRDSSMDSRIARSKDGVRSVGEVSLNGRDRPARRAFKVGTRVGGENVCENSAKESSDIKPAAGLQASDSESLYYSPSAAASTSN